MSIGTYKETLERLDKLQDVLWSDLLLLGQEADDCEQDEVLWKKKMRTAARIREISGSIFRVQELIRKFQAEEK